MYVCFTKHIRGLHTAHGLDGMLEQTTTTALFLIFLNSSFPPDII
jgi:hypothetical protein